MADVWVVLLIVGFFAVCVAFVRGCDRIIGGDESSEIDDTDTSGLEAREREPTGVAG